MTRSQATPASSQIIAMERMIEERDETIAAQAAVIEKLRGVLNDSGRLYCTMLGNELMTTPSMFKRSIVCKFVRGWFREMQPTTIQKALATPTDSKEVLKAWLDEVLGEPVGWLQTSVEEGLDTTLLRCHKPKKFNPEWWKFEPLFRKPAL